MRGSTLLRVGGQALPAPITVPQNARVLGDRALVVRLPRRPNRFAFYLYYPSASVGPIETWLRTFPSGILPHDRSVLVLEPMRLDRSGGTWHGHAKAGTTHSTLVISALPWIGLPTESLTEGDKGLLALFRAMGASGSPLRSAGPFIAVGFIFTAPAVHPH
jgi:hypothetical protein